MKAYLFFLFFSFLSIISWSQTSGNVYIKASTPRDIEHAPDLDYPAFNLTELYRADSSLAGKMKYFELNYLNPPLKLKGCTYFYPNQKGNVFQVERKLGKTSLQPAVKDTFRNMDGTYYMEDNPDWEGHLQRWDPDGKDAPAFLRFYADTTLRGKPRILAGRQENLDRATPPHLYSQIGPDPFFYKFGCTKSFSEIYRPFYFKNTEVSNLEYREFVMWVRDSIARTILLRNHFNQFGAGKDQKTGREVLNWKIKLDFQDTLYSKCLDSLMLPEQERFYTRREVDSRKLVYSYDPYPYEKKTGSSKHSLLSRYFALGS